MKLGSIEKILISLFSVGLLCFLFLPFWPNSFNLVVRANADNGNIIPSGEVSPISQGFYGFTMNDINGKSIPLTAFKGKVLLVVNTASFCGNTPQYEDLQTLYHQYKEQGFEILAFPSNDFGLQEPGTNKEIAKFCYTKYAIDFPLFSKIVVKGPDKHPLYQYLTEESPFKGEVRWNFQKYLLNRSGDVIAKFRPGLKPLSSLVIDSIEKALSQAERV